MKRVLLFLILGLFVVSWGSLEAGPGDFGVTGELKENFYAAAFHDNYGAFINPARLTDIDQTKIVLFMAPNVLGEANLFYSSVSVPFRLDHTFGFNYVGAGIAGIPLINPAGQEVGRVDALHTGLYLTYAWRVLPYLSVGGNLSWYNKNIDPVLNTNVATAGVDLGVVFNPFNIYTRGYSFFERGVLNIGLTMKNAFWLPLEHEGSQENIPMNIIGGIHYGFRNIFDFSVNASFMDLVYSDPGEFIDGQRVIAQNYNADLRIKVHPMVGVKAGWVNDGIKGGFDISHKRVSFLRYIEIGYDLIYKPTGHIFVHSAKLISQVGPTREEMYARRLFDMLRLAPNDLYQRALALYRERKYWEASWLFAELITRYPRFYLVDAATYYLGSSYENLQMDQLARDVFRQGLNLYTVSKYRAFYYHGLQNLDYKAGDYESATNNFRIIINQYGDTEIIDEVYYIAGQVLFNQGQHDLARQHLTRVDRLSKSYPYAQYTLGVIEAINKNYDQALLNLTEVVNVPAQDDAHRQLQNRANILAGHILQEQRKVREAIERYLLVTPDAPFYDEALLGVAWGFLKYGRTVEAAENARRIKAGFPHSRFRAEAALIEGFAAHRDRTFDRAVVLYEEAISIANSMLVDEEELRTKEAAHREAVSGFAQFQEDFKGTALRRADVRTPERQSELKANYDNFIGKFDAFENFQMRVGNVRKFIAMSKERIVGEAEFARANAYTNIQADQREQVLQEARDEAARQDEELRRLEQELEELERLEQMGQ